MKGFKAYNKGMTCRGFQFEEQKEYGMESDPVKCTSSGFHFCKNPLDVSNYYDLLNCEFSEVEAIGKIDDEGGTDTKVATNKIKILNKMSLNEFINKSVEYLFNENKTNKNINSGDYAKLASSGDYAKLASSGDYAKLASSGNYAQLASSGDSAQLASSGNSAKLASSGDSAKLASSGNSAQLASSGNYAKLASSGNYAKLASSGNSAKLASSGDYAQLASSGNYAKLASSGDYAKLASSGNSAKLESNGKNSVIANIGIDGKAKGFLGTFITLAEYDRNNICINVKSRKVDGKHIKPDVWYKLIDNKFTIVD